MTLMAAIIRARFCILASWLDGLMFMAANMADEFC